MNNLGPRIARAALAQGTTAVIGKACTIASTIVLARLLYPDDFGIQTAAVVALSLATVFSNFGFQAYIIQARQLSDAQINACFTLNVMLSAALGLLVAGAGLLVPGHASVLGQSLVLYGLMIFVSGLSYSRLALMKRDLRFRESSRAELAFSVTSSVARVAFASIGLGALAFAMGDVLGALARWLLSHQPDSAALRLQLPRGEGMREILTFGAHTASVGFASFLANQIDKALLSATQSAGAIGLYGFATTMAAMFYNALIVPQSAVFLAAFSRLQDSVDGARALLVSSSRFIFSLALPLGALWILEAERIVHVVFGARWIEAALIIRILSIDYLVRAMFSGFAGLQLAFGRAREAAATKWINSGISVAFMLTAAAARMDIRGYAVMFVAASLLATAHNAHVNGKVVGVCYRDFAAGMLPPALIGLASSGCWWLARQAGPAWPTALSLVFCITVWSAVYLVLTLFFNRVVVNQIREHLTRKSRAA